MRSSDWISDVCSSYLPGTERQPVYPWPNATAPGEDVHDQPGVVQNAQVATLAARIQSYNGQPRKEFVAPSAQASRYAAYLDAWRSRIEAIGTQHYPEEARGRIYGSLQITVSDRKSTRLNSSH